MSDTNNEYSVLGYDNCGTNVFAAYAPSLGDAISDAESYKASYPRVITWRIKCNRTRELVTLD